MARGWESKAVEELRDEAATAPTAAGKPKAPRTAEQQELVRKRDELQLARKRILADLGTARHPRHKELLERTLADLDERISKLGELA
jgi:hypothetical protein